MDFPVVASFLRVGTGAVSLSDSSASLPEGAGDGALDFFFGAFFVFLAFGLGVDSAPDSSLLEDSSDV